LKLKTLKHNLGKLTWASTTHKIQH